MFKARTRMLPVAAALAMAVPLLGMVGRTPAAFADTGTTSLVSVSDTGGDPSGQYDSDSTRPAADADGNLVVFSSKATNLVPNDPNNHANVYLRNVSAGTTTLISVSDNQSVRWANGDSTFPDISADGRWVVFESSASNLVPGQVAGPTNVFEYDTQTGTMTEVSVSDTGGTAKGSSTRPTVSEDGQYVVWNSTAKNLVPDDNSPAKSQEVFVRDMDTGVTSRVSVPNGGGDPNGSSVRGVISADGTHVAFISWATNLVPNDTNGKVDVFERDLVNNVTSLVSVAAGGGPADGLSTRPSISATGQYVAFQSTATNLIPGRVTNHVSNIYRRDMLNGVTILVSVTDTGGQPVGASTRASIDGDGNIVAFASNDSHIVAGDTNRHRDVFLRDINAGTNTLVSVSDTGGPGDCSSVVSQKGCLATRPAVSEDGNAIIFMSTFTNLTSNATTGVADVFVRTNS